MPLEPNTYLGTCRNGHDLHVTLPAGWGDGDRSGRWVRCGECENITYCRREKDETKAWGELSCPWLVVKEDPRVTVL